MDKQALKKGLPRRRVITISERLRPLSVAAALCLLARPAAASVLEYQAPLVPLLLLFAVVLVAAGAYLWILRKVSIFRDAMGSVARPRQIVDPDGRTFYATPAFRELFGDDAKAAPEHLADQCVDPEALEQIELLARNASHGIPGYAEIRVRGCGARPEAAPGSEREGSNEWRVSLRP